MAGPAQARLLEGRTRAEGDMKPMRRLVGRVGAAVFALALGTGCALHRSVVEVAPPQVVQERAEGEAVVIARVTDQRRFAVSPADPSTPSLMDAAITDKAITARAVGRKRGGFGKAYGDVLLPEGRSVEDMVRDTVADALRRSGYRVVPAGGPSAEGAKTLEVDIKELWTWFSPGFWYVALNFRSVLDLNGPVIKDRQHTVRTELDKGFQVVVERDWTRVLEMGFLQTGSNVADQIVAP
jgi:hypothetical protein